MSLLILSAAFFVIIASTLRKGADIYSPAKVFGMVWVVAIGLAEMKFSRFQFIWDWYSWFVVVSPIISFLIGTFIAYVLNLGKPMLSIAAIRTKILEGNFNTHRFYYGIIVFYLAYVSSFVIQYLAEGFVPIFSKHMDQARLEYGIFGFNLIVIGGWLLMFLCIEYLTLTYKNGRNKIRRGIIIFIAGTTFITYLTLLQRFPLMMLFMMSLSFMYYSSRIYKPKWILTVFGLIYLLLQGIHSIRVSQYVTAYHYVISQMKYDIKYAAFTEPYMYIVMNLENSAWAAKTVEKFSYGVMNFDWLLALTQMKRPALEYFMINPIPLKEASYNTFSFIWYFYSDFGIFGITIVPMLFGMIIAYSYYRMRQTGTLNWVVAYSFGFYWMSISFFTNPLFSLNVVSSLLILWAFHKFTRLTVTTAQQ